MTATICLVNPGDVSKPRGGENRVIAFAVGLKEHGFDVHLIVPKPIRKFPEELQEIKIHTVNVSSKGSNLKDQFFRALALSQKARKVAWRYNAILQFEHSPFAGFATLFGHSNFILDMHDLASASPVYTSIPLLTKFIQSLEKKAVFHAHKIIVVSNTMKKYLIEKWKTPEDKVAVIPNGYFKTKFSNISHVDHNTTENLITFLGTLHLKLDLNKIIYLAKFIKSRHIKSKIFIIGDGPARAKLDEMIEKNELGDVLVVTGWISDKKVLNILVKSQVCILPEHRSKLTVVSCPVKLFEYGALGKAIVMDDVAEICKMFKECNAAIVVNPNNIDEFIESVVKLLNNSKLRKKLSVNVTKITKKFSWENQSKKLAKIYDNILSTGGVFNEKYNLDNLR